jgi:hypothetical protein
VAGLTPTSANFADAASYNYTTATPSAGGYFKSTMAYTTCIITIGTLQYNYSIASPAQIVYLALKNYTFYSANVTLSSATANFSMQCNTSPCSAIGLNITVDDLVVN